MLPSKATQQGRDRRVPTPACRNHQEDEHRPGRPMRVLPLKLVVVPAMCRVPSSTGTPLQESVIRTKWGLHRDVVSCGPPGVANVLN